MATAVTEEMRLVRGEASRFADRFIRPRRDLDTAGTFPLDIWQRMGEEGLLGLSIPRDYGGKGKGYLAMAVAGEALASRGRNLGMTMSWLIHLAVARFLISRFGDPAQREKWLPRLASGRITASLAVSEPERGAHPKHLTTIARASDDGYTLNGEKTYLTNGPIADLFVAVAVSGEERGRKAFSAFLVPRETPGLSVSEPMELPFLRPSPHGGIRMENCLVPASSVLGRESSAYVDMIKPFRAIEDALMMGPMAGGMAAQLDLATAFARSRGLGHDTSAVELGRFRSLIQCMRILAYEAAAMMDSGETHSELEGLLLASREITESAQSCLDRFMETSGLDPEGLLERITHDIRQSMKIARNVIRIKQANLGRELLQKE